MSEQTEVARLRATIAELQQQRGIAVEAHGRVMAERDRWHQIAQKMTTILCDLDPSVNVGYDGDEIALALAVVELLQTTQAALARLRAAGQQFIDHYPYGINPYLDEAATAMRDAL